MENHTGLSAPTYSTSLNCANGDLGEKLSSTNWKLWGVPLHCYLMYIHSFQQFSTSRVKTLEVVSCIQFHIRFTSCLSSSIHTSQKWELLIFLNAFTSRLILALTRSHFIFRFRGRGSEREFERCFVETTSWEYRKIRTLDRNTSWEYHKVRTLDIMFPFEFSWMLIVYCWNGCFFFSVKWMCQYD